eukprot:CAMPEP_0172588330 /NCGR_PEP_ID=MMETSP1068-20121228/7242_1 /TAXON_ID=35684 /ORGANISM="Pseudopedinella elastica, Strain CCMP716" /LENGTH=386 /DNA_ID=CAMNT_0013383619 /DNA_START=576 /DNA_END=1736 /DNA_ORIENTATION=-
MNMATTVIGLCGCSASGKSTLCQALAKEVQVKIISCDDFFRSPDECPTFDLEGLPWPGGGGAPAVFRERGNHDQNVPQAVVWHRVLMAVHAEQLKAEKARAAAPEEAERHGAGGGASDDSADRAAPGRVFVVVEGHLLLAGSEGAAAVRGESDHLVVLDDDAAAFAEGLSTGREGVAPLWERKWARSRKGKPSYKDRGVTRAEYACYWEHYVEARWREYGFPAWAERLARGGGVSGGEEEWGEGDLTRLAARAPVDANLRALLATGWFDQGVDQGSGVDGRRPQAGENKKPGAHRGGKKKTTAGDSSSRFDSRSSGPNGDEATSDRSQGAGQVEEAESMAEGPTPLSLGLALALAAASTALEPATRASLLVVLVSAYYWFRGRKIA